MLTRETALELLKAQTPDQRLLNHNLQMEVVPPRLILKLGLGTTTPQE